MERKCFKEHVITKKILSGEIYRGVATHNLRVSHFTTIHSAYTPVDDVSKDIGNFSVIQHVRSVNVYRIFTSSVFIQLLEIFYFVVVGSCPNRHNFICLNLPNTAKFRHVCKIAKIDY